VQGLRELMNNPYSLVVFDWEGTLSDTLGQILQIAATEANKLGFGILDLKQARQCINFGLTGILERVFPHLSISQKAQLVQAVQQALIHKSGHLSLIPGALDFIKKLHAANVDMAIATNKGHHSLMRDLQTSGLDVYFKVTRSAGEVPAKPCPQMLQEIMDVFDAQPATTLMIGDSVMDMEMAASIKVTAIGFDFYHQQQDSELKAAGALAVFDEYALLADYLNLPRRSIRS
jgi:phosphoglycolate phosphatase